MLSIDDVLEILATPLLGIVPESQDVLRASNFGTPVTLSDPRQAPRPVPIWPPRSGFMGRTVPMTIPSDKKGLLNKLFGRRAA